MFHLLTGPNVSEETTELLEGRPRGLAETLTYVLAAVRPMSMTTDKATTRVQKAERARVAAEKAAEQARLAAEEEARLAAEKVAAAEETAKAAELKASQKKK